MGLFGLFYTSIVLLCKGVVGVQNSVEDISSKQKAIDKGNLAYFDHRGAYRLVSDNKQVYHSTLPNGERVLKDIGGNIVYNFDHDSNIEKLAKHNEKAHKVNDQIIAIGTLQDLFPEKCGHGIYLGLPDKTLVYQYLEDGKLFFRKEGFFYNDGDLFIDVQTGVCTNLNQELTEEHMKWIQDKNRAMDKTGIYRIVNKGIECL